jgi:zinc D-Ala-D-Ala dipeptidase
MAIKQVNQELHTMGYGLLIFDGYRPWSVTKLFWDVTPPAKRQFVADPKKGSRHNRGCAVDLTLYDLRTGKEVQMTGEYDEMSPRSYPTYTGGTATQRHMRDLLRSKMEAHGFTVLNNEWWHFDHNNWRQYRISDIAFDKIR